MKNRRRVWIICFGVFALMVGLFNTILLNQGCYQKLSQLQPLTVVMIALLSLGSIFLGVYFLINNKKIFEGNKKYWEEK
jgi:uncharacterized membrane protein